MKERVFIIHPSEIIRRGLNAILRNAFNLDLTQLEAVQELAAFTDIKDSNIIVFTAFTGEDDLKLVARMKTHNQLRVIHISTADHPPDLPQGVDHGISVETPADELRTMVSALLDPFRASDANTSLDSELTAREKDVLNLVALGHSNKEIADKLFISIHTVISHRKNITEKLGIKSISGLTVYAVLNKIIDTDQMNTGQLI